MTFEEFYANHHGRAISVAGSCHVPRGAADILVHEVYLKYLRHMENVGDFDTWLTAEMVAASEEYWLGRQNRI